ncbi:MAG: lysostaphin resistance A-like protein [Acidimicrobiales bacterium]
MAVGIVAAVSWALITGGEGSLSGPWLFVSLIGPQLTMLGFVVWVSRSKGRGVVADLRLEITWRDVGLGLAFALGGLIAAGVVSELISALLGDDPSAAVADLLTEADDGNGLDGWLVITAVSGATVVPVAEELAFRGLWWSALEKRGMSSLAAFLVSSAVFAVFHLEPLRLPVLMVLGMALGAGRLVTGRIGAGIVAHALVNGLAFTALLVELS